MAAQPSLAYTDGLEARAVRAVLRKGIAESGARLRYAASSSYQAPARTAYRQQAVENPYALRLPLRTDRDGPGTTGPLRVLCSRGARDGPAAELRERLQTPVPSERPSDLLENVERGLIRRARQRDKPLDERLAVQLGSYIGPEDATTTIDANVQGLDIPVRVASKRLAVAGAGGVELRPARYARYQAEETPQADGARLRLLRTYTNDRVTPLSEGLDFLEMKIPALVLEAQEKKERASRSPNRPKRQKGVPVPSPGLFDPHVGISAVPSSPGVSAGAAGEGAGELPGESGDSLETRSAVTHAASQAETMAAQSDALASGQRATADRVSLERTVEQSLMHLHGLATRINPEGVYVSGECPCECHKLTQKQLRFVRHRRCPMCLCPYGGGAGAAGPTQAPSGANAAPGLLVTEDLLQNHAYRQVYSRTYDDAAPDDDAGNDLTDVSLDSDQEAEEELRNGVSVTHRSGLTTLQERELLRRHLALLSSDLQAEGLDGVGGLVGGEAAAAFDPAGFGAAPRGGNARSRSPAEVGASGISGAPGARQRFPPGPLSRSPSPSALDVAARKQVLLADRLYTERLLADVSPSRSPEDVAAIIYQHRFMDGALRSELDSGRLRKGWADRNRVRRNEELRRQLLARSNDEIQRSMSRGSALNAGAVAAADKTLRKNMAYLEKRRQRIAEGEALTASYMGVLRDSAAASDAASQQMEFVLPSLRRDGSYSRSLRDTVRSSLSDRGALRGVASSLKGRTRVGGGVDPRPRDAVGTLEALEYYTQRPESRAVLKNSLVRSAACSRAEGRGAADALLPECDGRASGPESVSEPSQERSGPFTGSQADLPGELSGDLTGELPDEHSDASPAGSSPDSPTGSPAAPPRPQQPGSPARVLSPEVKNCLFDAEAPEPLLGMGQVRGAVQRARSRLDAVQRGAPSQSAVPPGRAALMKEEMMRSLAESALAELDPDPRVNATMLSRKRAEQTRRAREAAVRAMAEQRAIAAAYDAPHPAGRAKAGASV